MGGISLAQAMITAMITPALLVMAAGSFISVALVRLARAVDRVRALGEGGSQPPDPDELLRHRARALLSVRAVAMFVFAAALFVVAGVALAFDGALGQRLFWLPVGLTLLGMGLIVAGTVAMLAEILMATDQIKIEIDAMLKRSGPRRR